MFAESGPFLCDSSVSELSARNGKSMENGCLQVPMSGDARDTGDTIGRSWKEVTKSSVRCLPELRLNAIF